MTAPTAPPPASGALVVKTRVGDGILVGLASAGLGGLVFWAIAAFGNFDGWTFVSAVVGVVVGFGVVLGTRKGGLVAGLLAVVFSALAVAVSVYFISHSLYVTALHDAGRTSDVPLWQGFGSAKDVIELVTPYRTSEGRAKAAGWLLGPVIALVIAGWPKRRPILR